MKQVGGREEAEIGFLARPHREVVPVEAQAEGRMPHLVDERHRRLEIVGEACPGIELQRQLHARLRRQPGGRGEVCRHGVQVGRRERREGIASDDEDRDEKPVAEFEPVPEEGPVGFARRAVGSHKPSLIARGDDLDPRRSDEIPQRFRGTGLEDALGVAKPQIDGVAVAGGVVGEDRGQLAIQRTDGADGGGRCGQQLGIEGCGHRSLSRSMSTTSATATRSCVSESRSRRVTVPSVSVRPSIVRHHGVPASSCRA